MIVSSKAPVSRAAAKSIPAGKLRSPCCEENHLVLFWDVISSSDCLAHEIDELGRHAGYDQQGQRHTKQWAAERGRRSSPSISHDGRGRQAATPGERKQQRVT